MKLQNLFEATPNKETVWYHGSPNKFSKFNMKSAEEGHAESGAGIYFTTNYDEAFRYSNAGYMYSANIIFRKTVSTRPNSKPKRNHIKKLIMDAPDVDDTLDNWGSLDNAIDSMIKYSKSEQDAYDQVWYDFYNGNVDKYLEGMVKLGYDGFYVDRKFNGIYHAVVFNPKSIQNMKVEKL